METELLRWIPLSPLLGFIIIGLLNRQLGNKLVGLIGCSSVGAAFIIALSLFSTHVLAGEEVLDKTLTWISSESLDISFAYRLDPLSGVMALVVSGVGFVIHVYSVGYMHGDSGYGRYFAFLNLFVFFMLTLVLADNIVLLYMGWEGVGLCSYLLIGFWYEKKSASDAGKKAFIVNRIGDFGFLLGLILLFWSLSDAGAPGLSFDKIKTAVSQIDPSTITIICLLLFMGATGKSAQLPLYVWLPDAMEGPTPVSALIHAATMVTAGVYMVARMHFLFDLSPLASSVVAWVGAVTAVYTATIALVQNDIKRVLAYSTISQLGYMFIGVGVGAYAAGIFHLVTHAFFKALLFLGAGSVMHALAGETDLRKMGGLRGKVPWTFWTMFIGCMAIAGVPGLSGFFSKEAILGAAIGKSVGIGALGIVGAGLTAFYMFRLLFMTFFGEPRYESASGGKHAHESPWVMLLPLVILAFFSVIGGYLSVEGVLHPFFGVEHPAEGASHAGGEMVMGLSILMALIGIGLATYLYVMMPGIPQFIAWRLNSVYKLLLNKYYVDEIYDALIVNPIKSISTVLLWKFMDVGVIDDLFVNGSAKAVKFFGGAFRRIQVGNAQAYALFIAIGVLLILGHFLWR